MDARSVTFASRSPTAATSAASTACPPRGCRGWIARRGSLAQVLEGLEAAQSHPELRPIKVNVVALKDFTEAEVVRFAEFARQNPYVIRFIEFMPLDADRTWSRDRVLPNEEVRAMISAVYPLEAVGRERHGTSRRWRISAGEGAIGF